MSFIRSMFGMQDQLSISLFLVAEQAADYTEYHVAISNLDLPT